jgi:choline dehydrogenase-like flavoprotein
MTQPYVLNDDSVFVVIGSGAGGGTLSNELAQKGIDVVCLEAGSRMSFDDIENDPPLMNGRMGWNDERIGPPVWLCKTVGGTTVRWSGMTPRIQEHEFRARSTYGQLDDTTLIDWPLTLDELAPYYDKAENKIGVTGTHGMPPSFETSNYKVLKAGGENIGYNEITSTRTGINSVARDGRPGCMQIGFCHSGCKIGAKWSTLYTEVPKAESTDHFELRTGVMVLKINHNDSGKVTGVVYSDAAGTLHEQKARGVAVAGNVVETTRLLLNSESSKFTHGLGNSSGQLGKNYTRHVMSLVYANMPGPVHFNRGTRQSGLIFDEQYHKPDRGFAGGYILQTSAADPWTNLAFIGGWGESAARLQENYTNLASLFVSGEDPPQASNKITLHSTKRDQYDLPVPVTNYAMHSNSTMMQQHAINQSTELYESLGGTDIRATEGVFMGCHNMGVARMSHNPQDGVTNRWGQTHDIPNLFVSDGSVFTSSGAANPTLTIVALAIRQADHIAQRMSRKEL